MSLADLLSAGHRWENLRDGYTLAQIQLFSRALVWSREQEKLDRAEAVALGIAQAFDADTDLIGNCRRTLAGEKEQPGDEQMNTAVMTSLFGNVPVLEK